MNTLKPIMDIRILVKNYWSLFLILSTFFLFATKTSFNIPLYIMALVGAHKLIKNRSLNSAPEIRLVQVLFFSIWLPMLFSLTDAVDLSHSLKTTLPYLRFLFVAYFIVDEVKKKNLFNPLLIGAGIIIGFWCLDALFQFFTGADIFGYPIHHASISGLFSPKNSLGHVLAVFSPVCFEFVRRHYSKYHSLWLLLLLIFSVILLGGKRAAWIMALTSCGLYATYLIYLYKGSSLKTILMIFSVATLSMGLLVSQHQPLQKRVDQTLGLFSGDREQINKATSTRLPIWETGINIYRAHWINGIGPRGFRHVYTNFADPDNYFLANGLRGATHPHLTLLEILVETGAFGFLGYLIFWLSLLRASYQAIKQKVPSRLPWLMSIMVAVLPYNSGLAFYGSYWSSVIWCTILVSCCYIGSPRNWRS